MATIALKQLLFRLGQTGLLTSVDSLSEQAQDNLEKNLLSVHLETLEKQVSLAKNDSYNAPQIAPLKTYITKTDSPHIGQKLLQEGKVGTIILAGGQGSRFGHNTAKALFPISLIKQKSLLQLFLEKSAACGKSFNKTPHVAIMTSSATHDQITTHIQDNHYFGLPEDHVDLFQQASLPLLDTDGNLLISENGALLTGPDGNGGLFWHFRKSGLLDKWKKCGIEYISIVLIDNPLLDPFPIEMLSEHVKNSADITAGAIMREDPEEQVGVFVLQDNKVRVVEYSEITTAEAESVDQKGNLLYSLANISYFIFSMSFIAKLEENLPLHKATKKATSDQLEFLSKKDPFQLFKFEYFIFDLLQYSGKSQVFLLDRTECFAPLKNASGKDSVTSVQKALLERDRKQYEKITGIPVTHDRLFELSMNFYYPTSKFIEAWHKKPLPNCAYIEETL